MSTSVPLLRRYGMAALTPQDLSDWCLRTLSLEARPGYPAAERMQDEVAIQMPSSGEVAGMPVSDRAKRLRSTLLHRMNESPTTEGVREALFEFAEALLESHVHNPAPPA